METYSDKVTSFVLTLSLFFNDYGYTDHHTEEKEIHLVK